MTTTATKRVVVDPITRIEGHLRVELEMGKDGRIADAYSSGTAFRGVELIMKGRDPRDMGLIAQRICGVCTYHHYERSTEAVERAFGVQIPPNARLVRNLMWTAQVLQDHLVHFYQLHSMDWWDVLSALKADPKKAVAVAHRYHPAPFNASESHYTLVAQRLTKFASTGQLGPFANAYWGHKAYRLSPEENLVIASHYLDNLAVQRLAAQMTAIFGGKNPHPQSLVVGGVTTARDALTAERIGQYQSLLGQVADFMERAYLPDLAMLGLRYKDEALAGHGAGLGNYLAVGALPLDENPWETRASFLPRGIVMNRDTSKVLPVDPKKITEEVAHSWYEYGTDGAALHPLDGETKPLYTGLNKDGTLKVEEKYSWLKSPRYDGHPMEVGPLARMVVAYAAGQPQVRAVMDDYTRKVNLPFAFYHSTLGRTIARGLETKLVADHTVDLINSLVNNVSKGDERFFTQHTPRDGDGWSLTEVPRGSLSHWVRIAGGKVENFQAVVPSTWNAGPRDAKGQRGAYEAALIGQPMADPGMPLEVLRTIHSFDPCLACAVHLLGPDGEEIARFRVEV